MMYGRGKSDSAIVAVKLVNKAGRLAAESVERRAGAKGKAAQRNTCRAQDRESVSQALDRIRKVAKERKKEKFTAFFHHLSLDLLEQAFFELKDNAAPGVDGLTWTDYEADLERNLEDLFSRLHRGAYRAMPSRRVYIPKPDGRQRPLAVTVLEDKVVQRAERDLKGVQLIISDACRGLTESAAEYLPESRWQRCMVHFYRNVFSHVPATKVREVSHMLKAIHAQESRDPSPRPPLRASGFKSLFSFGHEKPPGERRRHGHNVARVTRSQRGFRRIRICPRTWGSA